jgi:F0F1-type ATP synthase assembly protein I
MNIRDLKNRIDKYKNNHLVSPGKRIKHYKITSSVICMEIVASLGTGIFIGHILDRYFNTKYIFKVLCLVFAFIACFIVLYKLVKD